MAWRCLLAAAFVCLTASAAAITGSPPRVTFDRDEDSAAQLFQIERDHSGVVYIGSSEGVLTFDGEFWEALPVGAAGDVRSLLALGDRLFVGGYNQFGEMRIQDNGQRVFEDLTPKFAEFVDDREFADIWQVVAAPEGIYFRALRDLFLWQPASGQVQHWFHAGRFGALAHRDGETWMQFRGDGMRRKVGDEWLLVAGTEQLNELIFELVPVAEGGWISLGKTGDYWHITADGAVPSSMPPGLPPSSEFEHSALLSDGSMALASADGALYIVDRERANFVRLRVQSGFLSGAKAVPGGVLVAMDNGFQYVVWPSSLSVIDESQSLRGTFNSLRWLQGSPLISTTAGAFGVDPEASGLHFTPIQGVSGSSHDVWPLGIDQWLVAGSHQLARVEEGRSARVSDELIYPRLIRASERVAGRLYIGTEAGLRVARLVGGEAVLDPLDSEPQARRVDAIVEAAADEVWTGTSDHGVLRHRLDANGHEIEVVAIGAAQGIEYADGRESSLVRLPDGRLLASTSAGFFVRADERFERLPFPGLDALREPDEMLRLAFDAEGNAWAYSDSRLLHAPKGGPWRELAARRLRRGALRSHAISDEGAAAFVSRGAVVIHRPADPESQGDVPHIRLVRVTRVQGDGERTLLPLRPNQPQHFQAGDFALEFRFALQDLTRRSGSQYRGRLIGYESALSKWSSSSSYSYWSLPAGDYALEVEGRDGQGRISAIAPFPFVIDPPWHLGSSAKLVWLGVALLALWLTVRLLIERRTRRLRHDKSVLEQTVAKRTHELALANRQLQKMANVDGLTGISNRRALDEYYHSIHQQSAERGRSIALLAIDADHFKRYNDTFGHLAGDELLRGLVDVMSHCLRRTEDQLGRFGGEEFLIVLPGASLTVAADLAEHIRAAVESADLGVTISMGVAACVPAPGDPPEQLLARADAALYAAKHGGRNRISIDDATH